MREREGEKHVARNERDWRGAFLVFMDTMRLLRPTLLVEIRRAYILLMLHFILSRGK